MVRQHKIGRYTVDFAIRTARIAIEIDGGVHDMPGRAAYDATRQAHLESKDWTFVRFKTEETFDATHILNKVRAMLPLPSREGGGGTGEAPDLDDVRLDVSSESPDDGGSPFPLAPSPQGEGEWPAHLQRRTRANRKRAS